ncbi:MAG: serpin family protein [Clostridia bacterium]|nr:serpin family protein [Clostridia bacterium]
MKKTAFFSTLLIFAMMLNLCGCSSQIKAQNLMLGIKANDVDMIDDLSDNSAKMTDFAIRLFKENEKQGENVSISPLSVMCALAMTANGAKGETLTQMEKVLGMPVGELNSYLHSFLASLTESGENELRLANSIWFTDDGRFTVNNDFLQLNADYYNADIYKAPFDNKTVKDINNWIDNKTNGMIPEMLDELPKSAEMCLVNALCFDAEWEEKYDENQVKTDIFTKADGTKQEAEFMQSTEYLYLEDGNATGFVKYYKGGDYAFVALLPNEDVSLLDYVASLDGASLNKMLSSTQRGISVNAQIPKFETESSIELDDVLCKMGMSNAFDEIMADFSGLGKSTCGNIIIDRVKHKTYILLDTNGTKAAAATTVIMKNTCAFDGEIKNVKLDRPFLYMLIDCKTNIPFFVGTVNDIKK